MTTVLLLFLLAALKAQTALGKPLPIYGSVGDFALTNQIGQPITLADLRGKVWVADIIFTRCAGPCWRMTQEMKELEQALPPASQAKLVTLTTDPDFDTPTVMNARAQQFNADPRRWLFLTGTKSQIANLAIYSHEPAATEKKPEERESAQDLFIHSTIFVVIDKQAQLRGIFQTTGDGVDPAKVKTEILAAIRRLERER